jgi:hypothetical protein
MSGIAAVVSCWLRQQLGFHDEKCFMMKNECDAGKSE